MPKRGTVEDVLKYALKHKGLTEKPPGSNRTFFGEHFGVNGVPWCAQFTWDCLEENNVPIIKSAYTPTIASWFKDQKRGFTEDLRAKRGDLAFFDFPDSLNRIQHIGFVLRNIGNGWLETIEGNTSAGDAGSQDNGGGVFVRTRPFSYVVYYGRPAYGEAKPELPRFDFPQARDWLGKGDKGADVKTWQVDLNRWGKNLKTKTFNFKLVTDGEFGADTVKATKTFQTYYSLDIDGRAGQHTIKKMEQIRDRQKERD